MENKRKKNYETAVYPAVPTTTASIDKKYIEDYLSDNFKKGNISKDELIGWKKLYTDCVDAKGERGYFQQYRKEFVKAYFPTLAVKTKNKANNVSFADFIDSLLAE